MDCVSHPGRAASAYCQSCGRALCSDCVAKTGTAAGQILCEPCAEAWRSYRQQQPFAVPPIPPAPGTPSPAAAAILGIIPGVGAMYNGQFFKGLLHVVIFAILVSITDHYGIFGLFIAAWVIYQSFEAYHTAIARRDGLPLPDPLGLNEVGNWLNLGGRSHHPPAGPPPGVPGAQAGGSYPPPPPPGYPPPQPGSYPQPGWAPVAGYVDPEPHPEPPVVPPRWRRREPVGAIVLIGIGLILLLNQMGYIFERIIHYLWPLMFIAIGLWLIFRRIGDTKGGTQ